MNPPISNVRLQAAVLLGVALSCTHASAGKPVIGADQIVENIKSQQRVREHRTEVSIPESPWYFLAVMLVCGVEWSLRRKKRLI